MKKSLKKHRIENLEDVVGGFEFFYIQTQDKYLLIATNPNEVDFLKVYLRKKVNKEMGNSDKVIDGYKFLSQCTAQKLTDFLRNRGYNVKFITVESIENLQKLRYGIK